MRPTLYIQRGLASTRARMQEMHFKVFVLLTADNSWLTGASAAQLGSKIRLCSALLLDYPIAQTWLAFSVRPSADLKVFQNFFRAYSTGSDYCSC